MLCLTLVPHVPIIRDTWKPTWINVNLSICTSSFALESIVDSSISFLVELINHFLSLNTEQHLYNSLQLRIHLHVETSGGNVADVMKCHPIEHIIVMYGVSLIYSNAMVQQISFIRWIFTIDWMCVQLGSKIVACNLGTFKSWWRDILGCIKQKLHGDSCSIQQLCSHSSKLHDWSSY